MVSISGFNLVRLDRQTSVDGGVCTCIKNSLQYSILDDLTDPLFEVVWIKIRPNRLRGFSDIIVGNVYHPPCSDNAAMLNYLMNCMSSIESKLKIVESFSLVISINLMLRIWNLVIVWSKWSNLLREVQTLWIWSLLTCKTCMTRQTGFPLLVYPITFLFKLG